MEDPLQVMVSELSSNGDLKLCCYAHLSLSIFHHALFQL